MKLFNKDLLNNKKPSTLTIATIIVCIILTMVSWIVFFIFGLIGTVYNIVGMVVVGTFIVVGGFFISLIAIIIEKLTHAKQSKYIDVGNITVEKPKTREEIAKEKVYEIIEKLKNGIFDTECYDTKHIEYQVDEVLNKFQRNYKVFEKYFNNKEITNIIHNFLLENVRVVNKGSFNEFLLDYNFYDRFSVIKNAITKYSVKYCNINLDEEKLFDLLYDSALKHEEVKIPFKFKEDLNKEQEEFISLINSAYKFLDNDKIYIQESLCDKFRKAFEYSDELPDDIYALASHLCITDFDKYDFDWETNEYNLLYKPVKDVYEKLRLEYKNAFLLKTGLIKKYNDLNDSVVFMLMQYHLNQFKLNKAKKMVKNFDKIHYDNSGLLFDESDECNQMLQYLYDEEYTIEDIIKLDKLLNNQTAGEELVGLVQVDVNFIVVDVNDKYKFVIDKFNEFLSEEYINKLSTNEVIEKKKITIDDIDRMNGIEFENFVAELFEKMGYNTKVTKVSNDQGVDVIATRREKIIAIQAKCYNQPVGNHAIMEVCGGARYYNATECMVITNQEFTKSAIELADANSVELWDRKILIEKLMLF